MEAKNRTTLIKSIVLLCSFFYISACTQPTLTHLPLSKSFSPAEEEEFTHLRKNLVQEAISIQNLRDPDVIRAFEAVPRHHFVLPEYLAAAYEDHALPIGTLLAGITAQWLNEQITALIGGIVTLVFGIMLYWKVPQLR